MKNGFRGIVTIAVVTVVLGPIVFGNSPRPMPYSRYVVTGIVLRQDGGAARNGVVSLVGKWHNFADSIIDLRGSAIRFESVKSVAVTDSAGRFSLDIMMEFKLDSLAVLISALDKPSHMSHSYSLPSGGEEITGEVAAEMTGCRGCETVTPAQTYIIGYKYKLSINETLPY